MPRGAIEIESIRLDFWPPFKNKSNAPAHLKVIELFQTQSLSNSALSHSQSNSLTHSLTLTLKLTLTPKLTHSLVARRRSQRTIRSAVCTLFSGFGFSFSFFSLCYFFICVMGYCKFEFFSVLGSSNFGFLQLRLVAELNLVFCVFVWVLGINGVIVFVVVSCFLGC